MFHSWTSIMFLIGIMLIIKTDGRMSKDGIKNHCSLRERDLGNRNRNAGECRIVLYTRCYMFTCENQGYGHEPCYNEHLHIQKGYRLGITEQDFDQYCPGYSLTELDDPKMDPYTTESTDAVETTTVAPEPEITTDPNVTGDSPSETTHTDKPSESDSDDQTSSPRPNNVGLIIGAIILLLLILAGVFIFYCYRKPKWRTKRTSKSKLKQARHQSSQKKRTKRSMKAQGELSNSVKNKLKESPVESVDSFNSRAQVTGVLPISTTDMPKDFKVDLDKLRKAIL